MRLFHIDLCVQKVWLVLILHVELKTLKFEERKTVISLCCTPNFQIMIALNNADLVNFLFDFLEYKRNWSNTREQVRHLYIYLDLPSEILDVYGSIIDWRALKQPLYGPLKCLGAVAYSLLSLIHLSKDNQILQKNSLNKQMS